MYQRPSEYTATTRCQCCPVLTLWRPSTLHVTATRSLSDTSHFATRPQSRRVRSPFIERDPGSARPTSRLNGYLHLSLHRRCLLRFALASDQSISAPRDACGALLGCRLRARPQAVEL